MPDSAALAAAGARPPAALDELEVPAAEALTRAIDASEEDATPKRCRGSACSRDTRSACAGEARLFRDEMSPNGSVVERRSSRRQPGRSERLRGPRQIERGSRHAEPRSDRDFRIWVEAQTQRILRLPPEEQGSAMEELDRRIRERASRGTTVSSGCAWFQVYP